MVAERRKGSRGLQTQEGKGRGHEKTSGGRGEKDKRRMGRTAKEGERRGGAEATGEERKRGDACTRRINTLHILLQYQIVETVKEGKSGWTWFSSQHLSSWGRMMSLIPWANRSWEYCAVWLQKQFHPPLPLSLHLTESCYDVCLLCMILDVQTKMKV
uniref:Uncharacterized protein n=1 Tax=Chelonoidis abingdonii TaxID=106734 RepID=A0A8C0HFF7_CHEAB